jgi:hypothetical protein
MEGTYKGCVRKFKEHVRKCKGYVNDNEICKGQWDM